MPFILCSPWIKKGFILLTSKVKEELPENTAGGLEIWINKTIEMITVSITAAWIITSLP